MTAIDASRRQSKLLHKPSQLNCQEIAKWNRICSLTLLLSALLGKGTTSATQVSAVLKDANYGMKNSVVAWYVSRSSVGTIAVNAIVPFFFHCLASIPD
ncbi:MAG: hypothetical protein IT423_16485 [Pirellulaceae bacterium]|nr:hypothetical protein [Pirellulaceae bacterium]